MRLQFSIIVGSIVHSFNHSEAIRVSYFASGGFEESTIPNEP